MSLLRYAKILRKIRKKPGVVRMHRWPDGSALIETGDGMLLIESRGAYSLHESPQPSGNRAESLLSDNR